MKNDNLPIHPLKADLGQGKTMHYFGLTKREYFAGLAMQGVLASSQPYEARMTLEQVASEAIGVADALLKQLEQ